MHRRWLFALLATMVVLTAVTGVRRIRSWLIAEPTPAVEISAAFPSSDPTPPPVTPAAAPRPTATARAAAGSPPSPLLRFVEAVAEDAPDFNPLLTTHPTTGIVARRLLPSLLGQDPASGLPTTNELATGWTASADGRIYTFTLRSDLIWSDGRPVSAQDVAFTYAAIADPDVQSPLAPSASSLQRVSAAGPQTVVVTLAEPSCAALAALRQPLLPSHLFAADASDLRTHPFAGRPAVGAGPFLFAAHQPDERIRLVRNPGYWRGAPRIDEWIVEVVPAAEERLRRLAAGEIDLIEVGANELEAARSLPGKAVAEFIADGYSLLALNLGDPNDPQPGRTADGEPLVQPPHPILGDARVRRALALGLDLPALVQILSPGGVALSSYVPPQATWAWANDLQPYVQNLAEAQQLLTEAGWTDEDGDGLRSRGGVPLRLSLLTNAESAERLAAVAALRAQWAQIGVEVLPVPEPLESAAGRLLAQRFDLALIGWERLDADPGNLPFWHSRDDVPGQGLNFTSYQSPEVDRWLDEAAFVPGCDPTRRGEIYRRVQRRIHADLPYIVIGAARGAWVYDERWQGIAPGPWAVDGNLHAWRSSAAR